MSEDTMQTLWLGCPNCHDAHTVGAKAATLSRLWTHDRIPPGFCLPVAAHAGWIVQHPMVAGTHAAGTPCLPAVPPALVRRIETAYHDLGIRCGVSAPRVAVRSSAVDEDGTTASFAGQYDTFLNLVGVGAVAKAVLQCWVSARSARVLAYRRHQGYTGDGAHVAVLIQQLIQATIAAVVFSANPLTGRRGHILLNVSWGLGNSIVRGTVTPDMYVVRKADLAIVERQIARKQRMTVLAPTGIKEVPVPRQQQQVPAATDQQVCEMARLSRTLEEALGAAVDIECAYQAQTLYLLQCRPITTLVQPGSTLDPVCRTVTAVPPRVSPAPAWCAPSDPQGERP